MRTKTTAKCLHAQNHDRHPQRIRLAGCQVYDAMGRLRQGNGQCRDINGAIFGIEASFARSHNVKHSRDISRSLYESATTRKSDPGRMPPYGFDRMRHDDSGKAVERVRYFPDGTKVTMDPETGEVRMRLGRSDNLPKVKSHKVKLVPGAVEAVALVRRIFRMAKTTGLVTIADTLNREGVPSPRGGRWSDSTLRGMVRNPAYKGTVEYGKTFRGKYHRVHREQPVEFGFLREGRINHGDVPEDDWYVEPERHEALIPPDEFDEVQAALDARSRRPAGALRSEKHVYWLSGIARCARCNAPLQGQTQGGKNPKYTCSTPRKYGSSQCAYYSLNAPELEAHVVGEVRKYLDTDCALESLRLGLEQLLDERSEGKTHLERVRLQAEDMAAKKEALFKMLKPDNIEMFQPQIDALTAEEKRLRKVIAEAEREAGVQMDREAFIANALEHYREHVLALRGGCENALRESLLALGISVTYDPDKKEGGIAVSPFVCSATA